VSIDVSVVVEGGSVLDGILVAGADLRVAVTAAGGAATSRVVERALGISAVLGAVRSGFSVDVPTS
jgi:hypothetical protein